MVFGSWFGYNSKPRKVGLIMRLIEGIVLLMLILSAATLVGCGNRNGESKHNETEHREGDERYISDNYDYNDKHKFVKSSGDSSDFYAVRLCDCVVEELNNTEFQVAPIISNYEENMDGYELIADHEDILCSYFAKWRGLYDKVRMDSIIDRYVLTKGTKAGNLLDRLGERFGAFQLFNIADLYEHNCKITAPYARLIAVLDLERISELACRLQQDEKHTCFKIVFEGYHNWFYEPEQVKLFDNYIKSNCSSR